MSRIRPRAAAYSPEGFRKRSWEIECGFGEVEDAFNPRRGAGSLHSGTNLHGIQVLECGDD